MAEAGAKAGADLIVVETMTDLYEAKAALLVDANTGRMVYGKNEHGGALSRQSHQDHDRSADAGGSGQRAAVHGPANHCYGERLEGLAADGSTAGIRAGEVLTVEQLLYCLLLPSANEAAQILAEAVGGDIDTFVGMMNDKAKELGCQNTTCNPTLPRSGPLHHAL